MEGCYYVSIYGTAFGLTQMVPIFVTVACTVLSMATSQAFYVIFAFYLYVPQYIVWIFQQYFQYIRPNPICQLYNTWAFPSMEAMYTGAVVGAFAAYAYLWVVEHSWISWLFVYLVTALAPFVLIYTEYNRWWEIAFSMGFGALSSIAFVLVVRYFMRPWMPYLKLHFPFYLFGYVDNMMRKDRRNQSTAILESLERVDKGSFKWIDSSLPTARRGLRTRVAQF